MSGGYNDGRNDYRNAPPPMGYGNNAVAAPPPMPDYRSNVPDYRSGPPPPLPVQQQYSAPPQPMMGTNIVGQIAGTSAIERGPDRRGEIRLPMPMSMSMPLAPPPQQQQPQLQQQQQPPQYD